jgi:hypothetical protein
MQLLAESACAPMTGDTRAKRAFSLDDCRAIVIPLDRRFDPLAYAPFGLRVCEPQKRGV